MSRQTWHDDEPGHRIRCHLDELLKDRGMTLTELAARAGITVANLAVLKNGRAKAIRFSTLTALCDALDCLPGDLLSAEGQRNWHVELDHAKPAPKTLIGVTTLVGRRHRVGDDAGEVVLTLDVRRIEGRVLR